MTNDQQAFAAAMTGQPVGVEHSVVKVMAAVYFVEDSSGRAMIMSAGGTLEITVDHMAKSIVVDTEGIKGMPVVVKPVGAEGIPLLERILKEFQP